MNYLYKPQKWLTRALGVVAVLASVVMSPTRTWGQVSSYSFAASSGTFTPISGGTSVATSTSAADFLGDTKTSISLPIGFTFTFNGVNYTNVVAASDGFISFNTSATSTLTNNLATSTAARRPLVAPLWDDLDGASGSGSAQYVTTGTAGSRVFTIEYLNWQWNYNATGATISFQVKLYEGTNKIEFVYRPESGAVNSGSASIGIAGVSTGAGNYLSLNGSGTAPTVSSTVETTSISTKPASGQTYTFTPPSCVAPSALTLSSVTNSSASLSWTAASPAPSNGYDWEVVPGALAAGAGNDVAHGSTAAGVVTASASGLAAGTAYTLYVRSNCGGSGTSAWASTTFTTAFNAPFLETFDATSTSVSSWSATAGTGASYFWSPTTADATHGAAGPYTSTRFASLNVYNASASYNTYNYTSPSVALDATPRRLKYYYYLGSSGYTTSPVPLAVQISVNGGAYSTIYSHTSSNSTFATTSATSNWFPNTIDLSSYANSLINIRFVSNSNYGSGFCNQGLDEVAIETLPSCLEPTALTVSSITASGASLAWTASTSNPTSGYEWEVVPGALAAGAGNDVAHGSTAAGVVTASTSGLAANTTYTLYVRSNCGSGVYSAWVASSAFTTLCSAAATFSQNFDGVTTPALPSCFAKLGAGSAYTQSSSSSSSPNCVYLYASSTANKTALLLPPVSNGAANSHKLSFKIRANFTTGGTFEVGYLTNETDINTFVSVYTGTTNSTTVYQDVEVSPSAALGSNRLAILATGSVANSMLVDDVSWSAKPTLDIKATALAAPTPSTVVCASATKTITVTVQNNGLLTQDFSVNPITVGVRVTGRTPVTTTVSSGTLAVGATLNVNVTTTFDMSSAGTYTLRPFATVVGDGNTSNDSSTVATVTSDATAATAAPYTQNFDAATTAPTGWTTTGWSIASTHANGTGNGLYKNIYTVGTSGQFTAAKVGPVSATDGVYFDYRVVDYTSYPATATTDAWGNFKIQVSSDCGATYTDLATVSDATHTPTLNWTTKKYSLAAYAGQNVVVRVVATWNDGDYFLDFDNFAVKAIPALDMSASALASPLATGCYTSAETVKITVKNEGTAAINFATKNVTVAATATSPSGVVTTFTPVVLNSGTLAAGATQDVVVSTTYNMTESSYLTPYIFNATTVVSGDGESANDAMAATEIYVEPTKATPYSENFNVVDANLGWGIAETSGSSGITATNATTGVCLGTSNNVLYVDAYSTDGFAVYAPKAGLLNANSAIRFKYAVTTGANCTAFTMGTNTIAVQASTDCGATYTTLYTINATNHTADASVFKTRSARLDAALAGFVGKSVNVRFLLLNSTGTLRFWVDDFEVYTDLPDDVQATALVTPATSMAAAAGQTVTIRVKNSGSNTIDFSTTPITVTASATLPNATINTFTPVVVNTGTLASGATQDVVVAAANFDMSVGGTYVFNASATITGDADLSNDAMSPVSVSAYAPFKYDIAIDSTNFTSIMSTGSAITGWVADGSYNIYDEGWSGALDLSAYNFKHQGVKVTTMRVNTNGFLTFEGQLVTGGFFSPSTQLTTINTYEHRRVAPFWADLVLAGSTGNATVLSSSSSPIKYQISGAPGSRVLTVEWAGMEKFANAGPDMNFQAKFYEATEKVEFVYGTMKGFDGSTNTSWNYVTGMSGSISGDVIAQGSANITNFKSTTTTLNWAPKCNSRVTFVPNSSATLPTATLAAPSYDNAATAKVVPVSSGVSIDNCTVYRTVGSTASNPTYLGTNSSSTSANDVWFKFTTTVTANTKISVLGGYNFNGAVQLVKDTTAGAFKQISFANTASAGGTDTLRVNNLPAGTYYARVYDTGSSSAGVFNFSVYAVVPPPANDNCTGAVALTVQGTTLVPVSSGNTANATQSLAGCSGTADDDVWYTFTTTNTNPVVVQVTGGTGFNPVLQVYTGTCAALVNSQCVNNTSTGGTEVSTPITTAGTYYVRVYHSANGATPTTGFNIGVYSPAPNCATLTSPTAGSTTIVSANANTLTWSAPSGTITPTSYDVQVSTSSSFTSYVVNANVATTPTNYTIPAATLAESTTYYWRVTAKNANGGAVSCETRSFTTTGTVPSAATNLVPANAATNIATSQVLSWSAGSGFPSGYDVYFSTSQTAVNSMSAGALVVSNSLSTTYTPTLANSTTYYWRVVPRNANGPATTTTMYSFTTVAPAPANDNCVSATTLTVNAVAVSATTVGSTASAAGAGCAGTADDDVWFKFVATSAMTHRITVTGIGSFDPVVSVLGGSACGSLGSLQCANATTAAGEEVIELNGLTAGATYYVLVYSNGSVTANQGTFTTKVEAITCEAPTPSTVLGATATKLTWAAGSYHAIEIQWKASSTSIWSGVNTTGTTSVYRITGLTPNTSYTARVRVRCVVGQAWTAWKTVGFTTLLTPSCSPLSSVTVTQGATVAKFEWSAYTTNTYVYQIRYRVQGSSTWSMYQSYINGAPTLAARVTGLTPSTTYEWQIRNACMPVGEDWNDWSSLATFTTLATPSCAAFSPVTVVVGATVARFEWPEYTSGTYVYQIRYRVQGSSTWSMYQSYINGAPTLAARVMGLTPSTIYEWQIRNACMPVGEDWNDWSNLSTFTTLAAPSCAVFSPVTVVPSSTSALLSWPEYTTNTYVYQIRYRVQGSSTWSMYQSYINGAPTLATRITGLTPSTTYEWEIRNACMPGEDWNAWSATSTFTTGAARLGQELTAVSIYPNPSTGLVNVAGLSGSVKYAVCNSVGQQVISGEKVVTEDVTLQLDLSAYPQGAYILKVVSADGVATRQMILTGK